MTKLRCIESNNEFYTVGEEYDVIYEGEISHVVRCNDNYNEKFPYKVVGFNISNDNLTFVNDKDGYYSRFEEVKPMTKLRCIKSDNEFYTVGEEYEVIYEDEKYYRVATNKTNSSCFGIGRETLTLDLSTIGFYVKFELVTEDNTLIKESDRVYVTIPNQGVVIGTVNVTANGKLCALDDQLRFTSDGRLFNKKLRVAYPISEENYKALCQLHGEENVPHYDPMIRVLEGGAHVALVSNVSVKHAIEKQLITLIECYKDGMYISRKVNQWRYAVPCNERGEPIV